MFAGKPSHPQRAFCCALAPQIAQFFSFGTNDLTQMTFGFSRDDAEAKFLPAYVRQVRGMQGISRQADMLACNCLKMLTAKEALWDGPMDWRCLWLLNTPIDMMFSTPRVDSMIQLPLPSKVC
jgi:PEP-utilising enzyme, PEP-binding domain